jgi:hypothetical protein
MISSEIKESSMRIVQLVSLVVALFLSTAVTAQAGSLETKFRSLTNDDGGDRSGQLSQSRQSSNRSAQITNITGTASEVWAQYSVQMSQCDGTYCGWFPYAVQSSASGQCYPHSDGDGRLTWVGDFYEYSGSASGYDKFVPQFDPVRICVYVVQGGIDYFAGEVTWDVPGGASNNPQPAQPSQPGQPTQPVFIPQCSDGIDNDGDGDVDTAEDYGCTNDNDSSERLTDSDVPDIGATEAKKYMRQTLSRRFGGSYRAGYAKKLAGCMKPTYRRVRCNVSWVVGDLSFKGKIWIWFSRDGERIAWNYGYTIKRTNHYCLDQGKRKCFKTFRVR